MLTISSGHSADYLLGAVATGRENYYTGAVAAGEPPGRWYGRGAESLGLSGQVDSHDMTALYEHFIDPRDSSFRNPEGWAEAATLGHGGRRYKTAEQLYAEALAKEPDASPERREELRTESGQAVRKNVGFLDATFSVQKSVTVLHAAFEAQEVQARQAGDDESAAAWATHRQAVEDAIWAGNRAALDYLADHAGYSRVGHHGGKAGRFIDAHDFVVASFFQHDNRNHDPQLHIHNAILNRVEGDDGVWRTLDGASIYANRGAASAVGERTTEEHLARSLGVRFATRPDGKAREIQGIRQQVLDLFSTRRRAITGKTAELVEVFEAQRGRAPTALELDRLQRRATFATRRAKSHDGETVEQRLERWDRELRRELSDGLGEVAHDVLNIAQQRVEPARWSPTAVIETALASVQEKKAGWTRGDLVRAVSDALPDRLGGLDTATVRHVIDGLAAAAIERGAVRLTADGPAVDSLPDELRLRNGQSAYERPSGTIYATAGQLAAERALQNAGRDRSAPAMTVETAHRFVAMLAESGIELGVDQAAAVRGVLTSGSSVETLVGPAGTGKSFVVGALARAWQDPTLWADGQPRLVVGLASSQIATEVLADEGLAARNTTRWLASQQRLADGQPVGDDTAWKLNPGDLLVVDESAMTATGDLTAIRAYAEQVGAKLLLTGDHRQLAAVGAGGGMALVADTGARHELTEVRRFTAAWERDASLRLREGDPSALREYRKHGRIVDGGTVEQAEQHATRAYLADFLAGRQSLLVTDTNEQAGRVAAQVRAELVRLGRVHEHGVPLDLQGTVAGVGDIVQARKNAWHLAGRTGGPVPINREQYRVVDVDADGGLVVVPVAGTDAAEEAGAATERMTLPPVYVAEHVALGYASTAHAAQGLTVDTSHVVATSRTGAAGLYVGMSRGRHTNIAYVATRAVPEDAPSGLGNQIEQRDPLVVLDEAFALSDPEQAAVVDAAESEADARSVQTAAERFADVAELATAGRTAAFLDRLVADGHLTEEDRLAAAAGDGTANLGLALRQAEVAGHDPYAVLTEAVDRASLAGARNVASVLHTRITEHVALEPVGASYTDWVPAVDDPSWQRHLSDLAAQVDNRRRELGAETAEHQPQWAVQAFGPPPSDPAERVAWEHNVGIVAAHRELEGHNDQEVALPGPPKPGQVEAYASWRSAWRALGRPAAQRAEAEMTDGQLRVRVRAYEREQSWEPAYVAQDLAGTAQAEAQHRRTAEIRRAEAAAANDLNERERLVREAADAAVLAEALAQQREQLESADNVRAHWYAHTAETRAAAERARNELAARGTDDAQLDDHTTAEEWLAEHTRTDDSDDPHRQVTDESELTDISTQRDHDLAVVGAFDQDVAEPSVDIREETADEPRPAMPADDWTKVPSPQEAADAVTRAQRALIELTKRQERDDQQAAEEARSAELARWRDDGPAELEAERDQDVDDERVLQ